MADLRQEGPINMPGFQAVLLVCLVATPVEACDENTAVEVHSQHVDNELRCSFGWEDVIARSAQSADVGAQTYVRTICRKSTSPE